MKAKLFLIIILLGVGFNSEAQRWKRYRWESIFGIGATNFLGDLGGADEIGTNYMKDLEWSKTRLAITAGLRFKQTQQISHKIAFTAGIVAGDDMKTKQPIRRARDLNFRSPILELGYNFEFYLKKEKRGHRFKLRGVKGLRSMAIYPYGFLGVSGFFFAPQGKFGDGWHYLQELHTEGQTLTPTRTTYKKFQLAVPLGLGLKVAVDRRWLVSIEYGLRKTFTDYIDDVSTTYYPNDLIEEQFGSDAALAADPSQGSWEGAESYQQRGDPSDNDSYMFLLLSANYKLKTTRGGLPKFR